MKPIYYYNYGTGVSCKIDSSHESYFCRPWDARTCEDNNYHNPEWYIQQKIKENREGFFDFNKNLLDIGGCYGIYSLVLPFNHFYIFEPNKESVAYINANMLLCQKIWKTDIYCEILSNKHEQISFDGFTGDEYAKDSNKFTDTEKYSLISTTLDDHSEIQNVGLIKIDVEGMEWKVLDGGKELIKNNNYPPILYEDWTTSVECGNETENQKTERQKNLKKVLKDLGYNIIENWGDWETHLAIHEKH